MRGALTLCATCLQGDGITTVLESEEETGTGMVKAVLKVWLYPLPQLRPLLVHFRSKFPGV